MNRKLSGLAIASLVCSLLAFIPILGFVFWILALVFGFVSLSQIKKQPSVLTGKGFAVAGIIISLIVPTILVLVFLVAMFAGFTTSRMSAIDSEGFEEIREETDVRSDNRTFQGFDSDWANKIGQSGSMDDFKLPENERPQDKQELEALISVVKRYGYMENESEELAELIYPIYRRINFTRTNDTAALVKDIRDGMRVIVQFKDSGISVWKAKLTDVISHKMSTEPLEEVLSEYSTDDHVKTVLLKDFFGCSLLTTITSIIFEARGLGVKPIYARFPDIFEAVISETYPEFIKKHLVFDIPEGAAYHVATMVDLSANTTLIFDPTLNFISETFDFSEEYTSFLSDIMYTQQVFSTRQDLYKKIQLVSRTQLINGQKINNLLFLKKVFGKNIPVPEYLNSIEQESIPPLDHLALAEIYLIEKDYPEVLERCRSAMYEDSDAIGVCFDFLWKAGFQQEARNLVRPVDMLTPSQACKAAFFIDEKENNFSKATAYYKRCSESTLAIENFSGHFGLAKMYGALGDFARSKEFLDKSKQRAKNIVNQERQAEALKLIESLEDSLFW